MKFRKFSPLDRKYPIFELVGQDGGPYLDISKNDQGVIEICFTGNIISEVFEYGLFEAYLKEGLTLAKSSVETGFEGYNK